MLDHVLVGEMRASVTPDIPIGSILLFKENGIPTGFLELNGDSISQNDYEDLAGALSQTGTFNLPNLAGPTGFRYAIFSGVKSPSAPPTSYNGFDENFSSLTVGTVYNLNDHIGIFELAVKEVFSTNSALAANQRGFSSESPALRLGGGSVLEHDIVVQPGTYSLTIVAAGGGTLTTPDINNTITIKSYMGTTEISSFEVPKNSMSSSYNKSNILVEYPSTFSIKNDEIYFDDVLIDSINLTRVS